MQWWLRHGNVFLEKSRKLFTISLAITRLLSDRPSKFSHLPLLGSMSKAPIPLLYFRSPSPVCPSLIELFQRLEFSLMHPVLYYIFAGTYSGSLKKQVVVMASSSVTCGIKQPTTVPFITGLPATRISLSWTIRGRSEAQRRPYWVRFLRVQPSRLVWYLIILHSPCLRLPP